MRYLIGTGNYSMFDDGIGLKVVEYIVEHGLENGFQAIGLSTSALNLLTYFSKETKSILFIDTIKTEHPHLKNPGDFIFFDVAEVETKKELLGISTHEGDILKIIELAKRTGYPIPPITFMGIKPHTIKNEFGLSESLQNNLELFCKKAIHELLTHL